MQNRNTKEFKRLYGNLNELFRRIHDDKQNYPKDICARWFVSELDVLLKDYRLKERLTSDQIGNIIFMGMKLSKTDLIDDETKRYLRSLVKELRDMQVCLMV